MKPERDLDPDADENTLVIVLLVTLIGLGAWGFVGYWMAKQMGWV